MNQIGAAYNTDNSTISQHGDTLYALFFQNPCDHLDRSVLYHGDDRGGHHLSHRPPDPQQRHPGAIGSAKADGLKCAIQLDERLSQAAAMALTGRRTIGEIDRSVTW